MTLSGRVKLELKGLIAYLGGLVPHTPPMSDV